MIGLAEFTVTEDYYREFYDQWYRHVCRWRRFQTPLGVVAALAVVPAWQVGFRTLSTVAAVFAVVQLADSLTHRRRWIRERLQSSRLGALVSFKFMEDCIESSGPFSSGKLAWAGIDSCSVTDKGIFLRPDTGVSIYIPKSAVTPPEAFDRIVALAESA